MSELRVADCMHRGVISCPPQTPLEEVARLMRAERVSGLVVMQDGVAAGVISQTDLVDAAFVEPYMRHWRGLTARHLMTSPVISVPSDAPLAEAVALLRAHRIRRLVVTEPGSDGARPVGVLSMSDIVAATKGLATATGLELP